MSSAIAGNLKLPPGENICIFVLPYILSLFFKRKYDIPRPQLNIGYLVKLPSSPGICKKKKF